MPPADNMPDFDSMTPEEVMAWMESLAKRQGAVEGFTTAADVEIAEIDPDTVEIDEPGYVPFGQEAPKKPAAAASPAQPKPAASAPPPAKSAPTPAPKPAAASAPPPAKSVPTPAPKPAATSAPTPAKSAPTPAPRPAASTPPPAPIRPIPTAKPAPSQPAASKPAAAKPVMPPAPQPAEEKSEPAAELSGMAWLESLAANQDEGFPQLDFSSLSAEIEATPVQAAQPANPLDWLASLTESPEEIFAAPVLPEEEPIAMDITGLEDPLASGIDPMLWLESLAKRQGAKSEELTTAANMDVPTPKNPVISEPGYTDFSVEADTTRTPAKFDPAATTDPNAWLASLTVGEGFTQPSPAAPTAPEPKTRMTDQEIQKALASGKEISREDMEAFLDRQLTRQLEGGEIPMPEIEDYDPDAPAVPAEIPDWLLEQVQQSAPIEPPALREDIIEPPAVSDLPDWLKEDVQAQSPSELESIFETEEETITPMVVMPEIDSSDPWVEAFDEELSLADSDETPDWYERNLKDPKRIAAVERRARGEQPELVDEPLAPEPELVAGKLETLPNWLDNTGADEDVAVPDWLAGDVATSAADEIIPAEMGEIPDWLKETEVAIDPGEIPSWLVDTVEPEEPAETIVLPPAAVTPQPAPVIAPVIAAEPYRSPVPVPAYANVDADETLKSARNKYRDGDLDSSLREYESIIRANIALEAVVADMTRMVDQHKDNPSVYRVLGDGLMRQGKLQAALDTYRKALNQL